LPPLHRLPSLPLRAVPPPPAECAAVQATLASTRAELASALQQRDDAAVAHSAAATAAAVAAAVAEGKLASATAVSAVLEASLADANARVASLSTALAASAAEVQVRTSPTPLPPPNAGNPATDARACCRVCTFEDTPINLPARRCVGPRALPACVPGWGVAKAGCQRWSRCACVPGAQACRDSVSAEVVALRGELQTSYAAHDGMHKAVMGALQAVVDAARATAEVQASAAAGTRDASAAGIAKQARACGGGEGLDAKPSCFPPPVPCADRCDSLLRVCLLRDFVCVYGRVPAAVVALCFVRSPTL
jgi:hypothetical protein